MIDAERHNCKMSALTVCSRHLKHNKYCHELSDRINLEHFDSICKVLHCPLNELLMREGE